MILAFRVKNFLSMRDLIEFSMVAAPLKELDKTLIRSRYVKNGVLPLMAVFGANASGKSNLLFALSFMRTIILNSFSNSSEKRTLMHRPFLLDQSSRSELSYFEIDFIKSDIRYTYGFEVDDSKVSREWLFTFPNKLKTVLYTRDSSAEDEYQFGRSLPGSNRQIQSITRSDVLYLSAAKVANHPVLSEIFDFFSSQLIIQRRPEAMPDDKIARLLDADPELLQQVERYLAIADTGIRKIKIEKTQLSDDVRAEIEQFAKMVSKFVGNDSFQNEFPSDQVSLKLGHEGLCGETSYLDYANESLGTRYLMSILPGMLKALSSGATLVLDEITTSLHTLLARQLIDIFRDGKLNVNGAQLIFSSHDTNLLAPGVLRRDEVWFAEKSQDGVTSVYPLIDIKTKNTDNIERGYIQGRFGGIPFIQAS